MRTSHAVAVTAFAVSLFGATSALAEPATDATVSHDATTAEPRRTTKLHDDLLPAELRAEPIADVAQEGGGSSGRTARGSYFPVRWVDRPLTLPKYALAPKFGFAVAHGEGAGFYANAFQMSLGAAFGILDDLEVYLTPLSLLIVDSNALFVHETKVYYGTFKLGGIYRFFHNDVVELAAKIEFGASGAFDRVHLSWGIPVILHAAHVVRFSTGLFFTGLFPTQQYSPRADIAMSSISDDAPILDLPISPGIPLTLDIQVADPFWLGLDTGFGIGSFRGNVADNCYMPLGAHLGVTVESKSKPLVDITGAFSFPVFLIGSDANPPATSPWTVGLAAKGYIYL